MLSVNFTLAIQIVQFLIIVFLGKKMIMDPVMGTINSRDSKIDGMKKEAESLKTKVEQYKADYAAKMSDMKSELADYHKKIKDEAAKDASDKVAAVKSELDAKIKAAKAEIAAESSRAKGDMDAMVAEISEVIVSKIMLSA